MGVYISEDRIKKGILELDWGEYILTAPLVVQEELILYGRGAAQTTLKLADQGDCLMFDVQGGRIEMHDLTLDGNCQNQNAPTYGLHTAHNAGTQSRFGNCVFRNFGKSALYVRGSAGVIWGCHFENIEGGAGEGAIHIRDCWNWVVAQNVFCLAQTEAAASAVCLNNARECIVSDNVIEGGFFGVEIRYKWGHRIVSNVVKNSYGAGISANRGAERLCVAHNYVADIVKERGICLYQQDGDQPNACIVAHNQVRNAYLDGILMGGERHVIEGNIVTDSGHSEWARPGINLVCAERCLIQHNHCTDTQDEKTQSYGVREAASCAGNVIWHNHLTGNLTGALLIEGQGTRVEDNIE